MSQFLRDALGSDHPLFSYNLSQFEKAVGGEGVDTKLIADITEAAHDIMRRLGLGTSDTSAEELYHNLNAAVARDQLTPFASASFVVLPLDGGVVSFNLYDIIENNHHELTFENRSVAHGQRTLKAEIIKRYADHDRTDNALIYKMAEEMGLGRAGDAQPQPAPMHIDAPKLLAVGDIITDAFIKLSEDHAEVKTDDQGYQRLSFELGAKIPYDSVEIVKAVECSPNAAVSTTRLGLDVQLMSWLGDDGAGQEMIDYLKQQGVGTDELVVEQGMKSNYHYVLRYGADRTKLQKFEDYSYQWQVPKVKPGWLYLGVLGEKTWLLHEAILQYLTENSDVKLVFQPGMYHLMWGTEKMRPFYERAEIVILNREEAAEVTGRSREDVSALLNAFHDMGTKVIVITDGADGAYAYDGAKKLFMPNYPDPKPPLDRTGAGDAFASTIAAALALDQPLETALGWAPINSMSVVQQMGAQAGLLKLDELKKYLADAPVDYKPRQL